MLKLDRYVNKFMRIFNLRLYLFIDGNTFDFLGFYKRMESGGFNKGSLYDYILRKYGRKAIGMLRKLIES